MGVDALTLELAGWPEFSVPRPPAGVSSFRGGRAADLPDIERTALHQHIISRYTCHQPIP